MPPGRGAREGAAVVVVVVVVIVVEEVEREEGPAEDEGGVGLGGVESVAGGGRSWSGAKRALRR